MDENSVMSSIKALIYPNEGPHKIVVCYFKCSPRSLIISSDGSFSEHTLHNEQNWLQNWQVLCQLPGSVT